MKLEQLNPSRWKICVQFQNIMHEFGIYFYSYNIKINYSGPFCSMIRKKKKKLKSSA